MLEKLNNAEGKILRRWRSPQLGHPVVHLLHHRLCRYADALCCGEDGCRLPLVLRKIALAEEVAIQAVVVVMMSLFNVSCALPTVVVDVNCLVMHMHRRQHHHWQIAGQQQKRRNMSHQSVHLSGCKDTTFFVIGKSIFAWLAAIALELTTRCLVRRYPYFGSLARFFIVRSASRMARNATGMVSTSTTISTGMFSITGTISWS